jgi:hypothetical protein
VKSFGHRRSAFIDRIIVGGQLAERFAQPGIEHYGLETALSSAAIHSAEPSAQDEDFLFFRTPASSQCHFEPVSLEVTIGGALLPCFARFGTLNAIF